MKYLDALLKRAMTILGSRNFFRYIVGLLVIQAAWIACTNRYPMAFDEDYHFGIIRIYSHHLSPFLSGQPAGADSFGAVARDPSYLYQYAMSFPYRLIQFFTANQAAQIIILRFINIALFGSALSLYRRILQRLQAPVTVINGSLLLLVLIPVVPLLAGQINYDNLFIPAIALTVLLTIRQVDGLRASRFDITNFLLLGIACLLTSIVKYAFLPIFLALGMYLAFQIVRLRGLSKHSLGWLIRQSLVTTRRRSLIVLSIFLVVASGLFAQRYLVNVAHYGTPLPACDKVLTIQQCSHYGPWNRDYNLALNKVDRHDGLLGFSGDWVHGMWLRLYFTVDGPTNDYQTRGPFPLPALSAIVVIVAGLIALVTRFRAMLRRYDASIILLLLTVSFIYIGVLFFNNYGAYARTGQPVAINGRYLLPFLPFMIALSSLALGEMLKGRRRLASMLVVIIFVCQVWGGGALTFILRSDDSWYWRSELVSTANHVVKHVWGPITPGFNQPVQFLP